MPDDQMRGAAGLRVIELSRGLAGANAGFLLAAQGASVVVATEPAGRRLDALETAYFDRGKQFVEPAALADLLPIADIVISDLSPTEVDVLGLPVTPEAVTPGKVVVLITPFGIDGPNRDLEMEDITLWAAGGLAYITRKDESDGSEDEERPRHAPGRQPELFGGMAAASAAVVGALHAEKTGEGVLADVSLQEVQASAMLQQHLPPYIWSSLVHGSPGSRQRIGVMLPAADGEWYVRPYHGAQLLPLAGHPELLQEPWAQTLEGLHEHSELIIALLSEWAMNHDREWIAAEAQKRRVPVSIPRTPQDLLDWDHLAARGFWDTIQVDGAERRAPVPPVVGRRGMAPARTVTTAEITEGWTE